MPTFPLYYSSAAQLLMLAETVRARKARNAEAESGSSWLKRTLPAG